MSNLDLVSVLIPVYNVKNFLVIALDSIRNQTYINLEIIVVDDFSTDGTWNTLVDYRDNCNDPRLKIYRNSSNKKIVETLNFALSQSHGQYIARMDGDDISDKYRIEHQLKHLKSMGHDLVGVSNVFFNSDGVFKTNVFSITPERFNSLARFSNPISHNWLATRSLYNILHGYRNFPYAEDYDFIIRAILNGYKISVIPYLGMKIRFRKGNTFDNGAYLQFLSTEYIRSHFNYSLSQNINKSFYYDVPLFHTEGYFYKVKSFFYKYSLHYRRKSLILKDNKRYISMFFYILLSFLMFPVSYKSILISRFQK